MMELDKNIQDSYSYPLCPQEHRWIYNKLSVAERMGYYCGPSGSIIEKPGFYCMRPVMGCAGYGSGGFLKFHARQTQIGIEQPPYRAGYFWCEWFNGWHGWTNFTNDVSVYECGGIPTHNKIILRYNTIITFKELPESFRNISRHMVVEHIGGNLIEVGPRHQIINQATGPKTMIHESEDFGVRWGMYRTP